MLQTLHFYLYFAVLSLLINESEFSRAQDTQRLFRFREACENGNTTTINALFYDTSLISVSKHIYCIQAACQNGHVELVKVLLTDPEVDPSAEGNTSIYLASSNGHTEVVRTLLADHRVDPSASHNASIRFASSKGHAETVKVLLSDPRVDPGAKENESLKLASMWGYTEVVTLLLRDPRVPSANNSQSLRIASTYENTETVKLLLADPRVDLGEIRNAEAMGLTHLVQMIEHVRAGNHNMLPNFILASDLDILIGNCKAGTDTAKILQLLEICVIKLRHPVEVYPGRFCCYLEARQDEFEIIRKGYWANV